MNTSQTIAAIATALAAAQMEIQNPVKDRTARVKSDKADYTYNYADLSSVLDAVRPGLAKNGIAIVQDPVVAGGLLTMTTRLIHSSGEWIENQLSSEVDPQAKIQTLGSAITYLRRYALQAITGVVAEEDDDGNAAQGSQAQTERRPAANRPTGTAPKPAAAATRPAPAQQPSAGAPASPGAAPKPLTSKQRYEAACEAITERLGSKPAHDMIMSIRNKHGGESATDDQKRQVLEELEAAVAARAAAPAAT